MATPGPREIHRAALLAALATFFALTLPAFHPCAVIFDSITMFRPPRHRFRRPPQSREARIPILNDQGKAEVLPNVTGGVGMITYLAEPERNG
jgi:hypothetical protein